MYCASYLEVEVDDAGHGGEGHEEAGHGGNGRVGRLLQAAVQALWRHVAGVETTCET